MIIGIDASRAFLKNRTGIEEYSYQVIRHLMDKLEGHQVVLYVRKTQNAKRKMQNGDQEIEISGLKIPKNWEVRTINFPYLWTQLGLSLEMLLRPVDRLFIPAHTVPIIHPKNTTVTIHGLEYEFCPQAYSLWERLYMRFSIRNSCRWAKNIIAVSENTKKDLMRLYKVDGDKIEVVYEGYSGCHSRGSGNPVLSRNVFPLDSRFRGNDKYILFVGRIEERKNIYGIIQAFEILKEKHRMPHKLVLAGKPGYGYDKIKNQVSNSKYREEIISSGFVSEEEKQELYKNADVLVFPTLYEGFGLPVLEAQAAGVAVVASDTSSIPEVAGGSAVLVDPKDPGKIAEGIHGIISDEKMRKYFIEKGLENVRRFGWEKCADSIGKILAEQP